MSKLDDLTIAILGGTGPQGRGLAYRFAQAGLKVVVGSRTTARADAVALEISRRAGRSVSGAGNLAAATAGDIVMVAVPYEGHSQLLSDLALALTDKLIVDCVNPLGFDAMGAFALAVPEGSAAQQAAALLPDSRVVAAFHHVSAVLLEDRQTELLDTDVLVLGEVREDTDLVQELACRIPGMRGVYGGRLRNAHQVEALTANLISMNRRYKAHAGIRVTDVDIPIA